MMLCGCVRKGTAEGYTLRMFLSRLQAEYLLLDFDLNKRPSLELEGAY